MSGDYIIFFGQAVSRHGETPALRLLLRPCPVSGAIVRAGKALALAG